MKSTFEALVITEDSINYQNDFAQFLIESERSAYTIKNYLCDLNGFALWLKSKVNTEFAPESITPTEGARIQALFRRDITINGLRL